MWQKVRPAHQTFSPATPLHCADVSSARYMAPSAWVACIWVAGRNTVARTKEASALESSKALNHLSPSESLNVVGE